MQKSMGGIALGATEKQLEKFFGASHCSTGGCNYTGSHNSYTVSAGIASTGTKVTQIVFQSQSLAAPARRMHTNKKIGIGSTLTQLKKAYPKVKKSVGPGVGVTYYALESSHRDTRFVVNGKKKIFEIDLFAS
ncbi:MAG: hypothetical protein INR67_05920 [Jatrophihabitans endophyticus]|nr:hypothetical protein [Jatrophihabitans endophyticus]